MKLIVGLGNPGKEYENTRHNIGFIALDSYLGGVKWSKKFNGEYSIIRINNEDIIFASSPYTVQNLPLFFLITNIFLSFI